jgi:hypothetical protein
MLGRTWECCQLLFRDQDHGIRVFIAPDDILPRHRDIALGAVAEGFHRCVTGSMKIVKSRLMSRYGGVEFYRHRE